MQVFNGDDEVIGSELKSELDFTKDIYIVTALWLENSVGEILIAY
jgi:hypothetical protein